MIQKPVEHILLPHAETGRLQWWSCQWHQLLKLPWGQSMQLWQLPLQALWQLAVDWHDYAEGACAQQDVGCDYAGAAGAAVGQHADTGWVRCQGHCW